MPRDLQQIQLTALEEAIAIAGTQQKLGDLVGKDQTDVSSWKNQNKKCPPEMVLLIERATGVSRHRLRPDVFGYMPDDSAA